MGAVIERLVSTDSRLCRISRNPKNLEFVYYCVSWRHIYVMTDSDGYAVGYVDLQYIPDSH